MMWTKERILVIVKTYPNLGQKTGETVCTAGITDTGEWRRLYPIHYRTLPKEKRFEKFAWIEVETRPAKEKLMRKESYNIKEDTLRVVGRIPVFGKRNDEWKAAWKERKRVLLAHLSPSIENLQEQFINDRTSLGLIKPLKIHEFLRKPAERAREWERFLIEGKQKTLNPEGYKSPLDKIPFWMGYSFSCDNPRCKGHEMMCEDWETMQLFRKQKEKKGSEDAAFEDVRQKHLEWMKTRDLYFVVGTESQFGRFLIISVFYPPKEAELL